LICFSSCIKKCVNHLNNQNNPYLYNGKELDAETGFYYYGARYYDPKSSLWLSVDPLAEKMPDFSAYAYAFNNPVMFVDPTGMEGESIHLDKYGKVLKNIDDGDNSVYVHNDAKIKSDVDKTYSANNTSAGGEKIGEIGGTINIDQIYVNVLNRNMSEAKDILDPFTFKDNVKTNGKWDLKNNNSTIFGLANDGSSNFSFQGNIMESQDVGNHHFGAVALAYGFFQETFILKQAGEYQIKSGRSMPEWQIYKTERVPIYTKTDRIIWTDKKYMLPPYGDDPRDQKWIKAGFNYFKNHKS